VVDPLKIGSYHPHCSVATTQWPKPPETRNCCLRLHKYLKYVVEDAKLSLYLIGMGWNHTSIRPNFEFSYQYIQKPEVYVATLPEEDRATGLWLGPFPAAWQRVLPVCGCRHSFTQFRHCGKNCDIHKTERNSLIRQLQYYSFAAWFLPVRGRKQHKNWSRFPSAPVCLDLTLASHECRATCCGNIQNQKQI